jgi:hypothetical protein
MGMVAPHRRIGSAFFVTSGQYGDVCRFAREHDVSRQWVYREAQQVVDLLAGTQAREQIERLQADRDHWHDRAAELEQRLAVAVVVDDEKQTEFACVGQACGVTLSQCRTLLQVLLPKEKTLSVASLGRRTQAVAKQSAALLEVFDSYARPLVREGAGDEIYVRDPVLMVVEQESLCWVCGQLSTEVNGTAWAQEFARLPNLEHLARDGGSALAKGQGGGLPHRPTTGVKKHARGGPRRSFPRVMAGE